MKTQGGEPTVNHTLKGKKGKNQTGGDKLIKKESWYPIFPKKHKLVSMDKKGPIQGGT